MLAEPDALWRIARTIESTLGDAAAAAPSISPHIALRAALSTVPVSVVAGIDRSLQAVSAGDRLDEVLDELRRVRVECGYPPPAAPIGRILGQQAVTHVLTGRRWATVDDEMRRILLGEWGHPPAPIDAVARQAAETAPVIEEVDASLAEAREDAGSLAASEEDLCLVALFGERALPLLERMRGRRSAPGEPIALDAESKRVQKLIALLEDSDAGELTVEDGGVRITVRRREAPVVRAVEQAVTEAPAAARSSAAVGDDTIQVESPMVGTFYRASSPEAGVFVSEGDVVAQGQTLCILEAMKLFNEFKSEQAGTIVRILVENGDSVEFGQPLFELSPA